MGFGVSKHRRGAAVLDLPTQRNRFTNPHRVLGEIVTGTQRNVDRLVGHAVTMEEPVVVLELNPGGGNSAEDARRLEGITRHQPPADGSWIRLEQPLPVGDGHRQRNIPPEAGALCAQPGFIEVIPASISGSRPLDLVGDVTEIFVRPKALRLKQVQVAQIVADLEQRLSCRINEGSSFHSRVTRTTFRFCVRFTVL